MREDDPAAAWRVSDPGIGSDEAAVQGCETAAIVSQ